MRLVESSVTLHGNLEAAWAKLVNWQTMPEWDVFMESIHFEQPISVDSTGMLALKNGQKFKLRITQLAPMQDYTDEFSVLGTRFVFYHQLKQISPEQLKMYFSIDCEGLLSFVMHRLLSKEFDTQLATVMSRFKDQFENGATS